MDFVLRYQDKDFPFLIKYAYYCEKFPRNFNMGGGDDKNNFQTWREWYFVADRPTTPQVTPNFSFGLQLSWIAQKSSSGSGLLYAS